jgi:hypothetical protein
VQERPDEQGEALFSGLYEDPPPTELPTEDLVDAGRPGRAPRHLGDGDGSDGTWPPRWRSRKGGGHAALAEVGRELLADRRALSELT